MNVREVVRTGPIARWLYNRDWRAVTLPSFKGITIRYWSLSGNVFDVDDFVRAHEWGIHVAQIRKLGRLRYLYYYAREWLIGYQVARKYLHLSRRESARHAYDSHPKEQADWEMRL